jgi:hypothetical protein
MNGLTLHHSTRSFVDQSDLMRYEAEPVNGVAEGTIRARLMQSPSGAMLGHQLGALGRSRRFSLGSRYQLTQPKLGVAAWPIVGSVQLVLEGEQSSAHCLQSIEDGPNLVLSARQSVDA